MEGAHPLSTKPKSIRSAVSRSIRTTCAPLLICVRTSGDKSTSDFSSMFPYLSHYESSECETVRQHACGSLLRNRENAGVVR